MGIFSKIFGTKSEESKTTVENASKHKVNEIEEVTLEVNDEDAYIFIRNYGEFRKVADYIKECGRILTCMERKTPGSKKLKFHDIIPDIDTDRYYESSISVLVSDRIELDKKFNLFDNTKKFNELLKRYNTNLYILTKEYDSDTATYCKIKMTDIMQYKLIGENNRDLKIQGGTVSGGDYSIGKAALGYAVAGGVGAIVAGKNAVHQDEITTYYEENDNRIVRLHYYDSNRIESITLLQNCYEFLSVIMPEKDIDKAIFKSREDIFEEIKDLENKILSEEQEKIDSKKRIEDMSEAFQNSEDKEERIRISREIMEDVQRQNIEVRNLIYKILKDNGTEMRVADILAQYRQYSTEEITNQKVSALARQLIDMDKVTRIERGRNVYFKAK